MPTMTKWQHEIMLGVMRDSEKPPANSSGTPAFEQWKNRLVAEFTRRCKLYMEVERELDATADKMLASIRAPKKEKKAEDESALP